MSMDPGAIDINQNVSSNIKDGEPPEATKGLRNKRLIMQIQAFINAAEDVDITPDVVEDLTELLDGCDNEDYEPPEIDPGSDYESEEEIDLDALCSLEEDEWTLDQVKSMSRFLKEHGMNSFVHQYVEVEKVSIPSLLRAFNIGLCPELQSRRPGTLMYFLKVAMSREIRFREKIQAFNTVTDAVNLIRRSQHILILTGAGISVSCGIPDFRSRDGLYASLGKYELEDPQQMFDITYFRENPAVFYSFASKIYPSNFIPSPCHRFIKLVEEKGKLLRNYTQNIDTLETLAGVNRVLQCHGSFATASCVQCRRQVPGKEIEESILSQKVPLCAVCNPQAYTIEAPPKKKKKQTKKQAQGKWDSDAEDESDVPEYPPGIMKPDITFFGEKLSDVFDHSLEADRSQVDLILVIGTSLKVAPVGEMLSYLPHSVPLILINRTPIRHINPDIILLGNADDVILHICKQLDWTLPPAQQSQPVAVSNVTECNATLRPNLSNLRKRSSASMNEVPSDSEPKRVGNSHVWLFEGADGGKWLADLEASYGLAPEANVGEDRDAKKPKFGGGEA